MQNMNDILNALDEDNHIAYDENIHLLIRKFYKKYSNIDLFVWDFDQTITKFSTIHSTYNKKIKKSVILNKISDPDLYYHLVHYLLGKGKKVAIASWNDKKFFSNQFGGYQLIRFFMDKLFDVVGERQYIFSEYNIVSYMPSQTDSGKNSHLRILSQRFGIEKNKMLLLDDSVTNVQKAAADGYNVCYVPKDVNFSKEFLLNILH